MSYDVEAVRRAYRNGPASPAFDHVPSREERMAESMHVLERLCREYGGDPKKLGLGEHGALIGGAGKPPLVMEGHSRPFEEYCAPRLAPPSWFQHESLSPPAPPHDTGRPWLFLVISSYMAGFQRDARPSPDELHAAFLAENPSATERFWLYSVLSCATIRELRNIVHFEGVPLQALVRALHASGAVSHRLCRWLNQFAERPASAADER